MSDISIPDNVLVKVVETGEGREISIRDNVAERLRDRVADLRGAVLAGAQALNADLDQLPEQPQWQANKLEAKFGITLTADAGVVLSRAGAEATFEVTISFSRK
ncbi:CU044_2847 family protein [Actinoplanes sp. CA-030573]|uniref:CU044_2847 family protein n=1 Tax=Actinoplanes sp. CA-030573 TaxID=3239898 RepID=UPI003D909CCC